MGTFYSPSGHSFHSPSGHSEWPDSEWAHRVKINTYFFLFLGTFYSPSGHSFHSPSGHSEWPDSEWAHQVKINTIFFGVFGNFLFTTRSALSFPIRSLLYSPSGHSFHSPSGHSFHSPSGHSFHSPSGHSFHSPSGHFFHSPSGHSFHSPSGHSFHSPSSRSCHCTVQSLISFTVRSLISVVIQRYFGYLAVGNGCKTTATYTFHGSQAAPTRRQDHAFGHPQMRALLPTRDPQPATACPFNKTWRNLTNDINPGPSGQFRINKLDLDKIITATHTALDDKKWIVDKVNSEGTTSLQPRICHHQWKLHTPKRGEKLGTQGGQKAGCVHHDQFSTLM